jgi:hypothetical protein
VRRAQVHVAERDDIGQPGAMQGFDNVRTPIAEAATREIDLLTDWHIAACRACLGEQGTGGSYGESASFEDALEKRTTMNRVLIR